MGSHLTKGAARSRSYCWPNQLFCAQLFARALLAGLLLALLGCGGGGAAQPSTPTPNVTMLLQDAPGNGVAAFNIDVTGVALGSASGNTVVLSSPGQAMELRHTQLAPTVAVEAFTAQAGTYNSLVFTVANPQLTVVTPSGQILRLNSQTHPSATLAASRLTVPLSLTVSNPGHVNLLLDFDVAHSLSTDANGNYVVRPVINASLVGAPTPVKLHGVLAMVVATFFNGPNVLSQVPINALGQGAANQQFVEVQLHDSGAAIPIAVGSNTVVDQALGNLSSLRMGQLIYLSAEVQNDGTFLASSIAAGPPPVLRHYEGPVTAVHRDSAGNPSFDVVVQN